MPEVFDTGWRAAEVYFDDTLQRVAARELGDATRWPEIVWLNGLQPPYLTSNPADPRVVAGKLVAFGGRVRVPTTGTVRAGVSSAEAFGVDLCLNGGDLSASDTGDLALQSGVANLEQALNLRLTNHRGDLMFHGRYGNDAWRLVGRKLTPGGALVAARYCQEAVIADPRVTRIAQTSVEARGDATLVKLTAEVDGAAPLRLQLTL